MMSETLFFRNESKRKLKKYLNIVFALVLLLALFSCEKLPVDGWTVVDKKYTPAHTEVHLRTMIINKEIMEIPYTNNEPDKYSVEGKIKVKSTFTGKGELYTRWFYIDKVQYESLTIGDKFSIANAKTEWNLRFGMTHNRKHGVSMVKVLTSN
jgi:uncharacterized lipoprotein YehR (DUF1307 family)